MSKLGKLESTKDANEEIKTSSEAFVSIWGKTVKIFDERFVEVTKLPDKVWSLFNSVAVETTR